MFGSGKKVTVRIEFPSKQILKLIFIVSLIFIALQLKQVFILLFLSFILMASIRPSVNKICNRFKLPTGLSVALVYVGIITLVGLSMYFVIRPLVSELATFTESIPGILQSAVDRFPFLKDQVDPNSLQQSVRNVLGGVSNNFTNVSGYLQDALDFTFSAFGFLVNVLTVIIISIYMLLERDSIISFFIRSFRMDKDKFHLVYDRIETQVGAWVRGQLLLGVIVGVCTWIGLRILGIKFALPLAFLAGILEIIPIIGPIISAIPLTLMGLSISPLKGVLSLGLAILIQQLENHLLVPSVMKRAVGLSAVVTLVSLLIGSTLFGLIGSIIAVPVAAMVSVLIDSYLTYRDAE
jgi:predicted PurR-regulated permease PerM